MPGNIYLKVPKVVWLSGNAVGLRNEALRELREARQSWHQARVMHQQ